MHPLIFCSLTNTWFQDDYMILSQAWSVGIHNWLYICYFLRDKGPAFCNKETPEGHQCPCPGNSEHELQMGRANGKEWGAGGPINSNHLPEQCLNGCHTDGGYAELPVPQTVLKPHHHAPIPQSIHRGHQHPPIQCTIHMLMGSQDHPLPTTTSCRLILHLGLCITVQANHLYSCTAIVYITHIQCWTLKHPCTNCLFALLP